LSVPPGFLRGGAASRCERLFGGLKALLAEAEQAEEKGAETDAAPAIICCRN